MLGLKFRFAAFCNRGWRGCIQVLTSISRDANSIVLLCELKLEFKFPNLAKKSSSF